MQHIQGLASAIATVIRQLRVNTGLSQEKFADFAGLSRVYIAQLETGTRGASLNALILIGRTVGLSGTEIVARIETEIRGH